MQPNMYQGPPGAPPGPPSEFEFEASDNEHFASLASAMRFVGIGAVIIGLLVDGAALLVMRIASVSGSSVGGRAMTTLAPVLVVSLLFIIVGILNARAAGPFTRIHTTEGQDITHLMNAFERLRSLFRLLALLFVLTIAAAVAQAVLLAR